MHQHAFRREFYDLSLDDRNHCMTFNSAAKVLLSLTALAVFSAPALAITRWIPLPVRKAVALDETRPGPDVSRGAVVYKNCRACHDIGPNAEHRVGPDLTGVVGRPAASIEGYAYSEALSAAGKEGLVWSRSLLDQYLAAPTKFLPGNKMAYVGLHDDEARRNLIAYLATFQIAEPSTEAVEGEQPAPAAATIPSSDQQP
jgi:cytochrome c